MRWQATEWEKIPGMHITDKWIHKKIFLQLSACSFPGLLQTLLTCHVFHKTFPNHCFKNCKLTTTPCLLPFPALLLAITFIITLPTIQVKEMMIACHSISSEDYKLLNEIRNFDLSCSLPYSQCIEECLAHSRYSINICWLKTPTNQL